MKTKQLSSAQPGKIQQAQHWARSWLAATSAVAALCLGASPGARALTFSNQPPPTNPFYSDDWDFSFSNPDNDPNITQSSVEYLFNGSTLSFSTIIDFQGDATFSLTSDVTDRPYDILFDASFSADVESTFISAFYQKCNTPTCTGAAQFALGEGGSDLPVSLDTGQYLRFSIASSVDGGGELIISNFNATPVPSPLPFAGLGLAALGIYRARRCKITATPK